METDKTISGPEVSGQHQKVLGPEERRNNMFWKTQSQFSLARTVLGMSTFLRADLFKHLVSQSENQIQTHCGSCSPVPKLETCVFALFPIPYFSQKNMFKVSCFASHHLKKKKPARTYFELFSTATSYFVLQTGHTEAVKNCRTSIVNSRCGETWMGTLLLFL